MVDYSVITHKPKSKYSTTQKPQLLYFNFIVHINNNANKIISFNLGQFIAVHLTTSLTTTLINRKLGFIAITKNGNILQQSTHTFSTCILCYFAKQWPWCSFFVDNKPIISKPITLQKEHCTLYFIKCSPQGSEKYSYWKLYTWMWDIVQIMSFDSNITLCTGYNEPIKTN